MSDMKNTEDRKSMKESREIVKNALLKPSKSRELIEGVPQGITNSRKMIYCSYGVLSYR